MEFNVLGATESALAAATHLTGTDAGMVEALRYLARKIDTESELRELSLEWAEKNDMRPPSVDNVSIPTYLKYCDALGLTPPSRQALAAKKPEAKRESSSVSRRRAGHLRTA